jgi:hypothetical protein
MRAFVVLAAAALSGCIVSVTARRACSAAEPCPDGFSCDAGECLADGSQFLGETCSVARQCAGYPAVTCGASPSTCRVVCDEPLRFDSACIDGEYCRPEVRATRSDIGFGTCFDGDCGSTVDCLRVADDLSCVAVTPSAWACFERCEITGTGAAYADSCHSPTTTPTYCQPIGPSDHQSLICLDRLTSAALAPEPGAACDPVDNPCQPGAACVRSGGDLICRAYCRAGTDCTDPTASHCCEVLSGSLPLYAICQPDAC